MELRRLLGVAGVLLGLSSPLAGDETALANPAAAVTPEPGGRFLPIETPSGTYRVWVREAGEGSKIKLLLLHGGPGASHLYFKTLERPLVEAGFEVVFYDQLGGGASDRPDAPELWEIPRFVDEVEQVRKTLGIEPGSLVLLGHSWGGILAIEYALAHPQNLAGLVISNMMSSVPAYNAYARDVLQPAMDPAALAEIQRLEAAGDTTNPRYMELLIPHHYEKHFLRRPAAEWPEVVSRSLAEINPQVYVPMQGPSELGASGKLEKWDRSGDLGRISVPTLVLAGRHDTMDPAHMEWMSKQLPAGSFRLCENGSHLAMWDDPECYFEGLVSFLRSLETATP
jgi:proline iminopeptidase